MTFLQSLYCRPTKSCISLKRVYVTMPRFIGYINASFFISRRCLQSAEILNIISWNSWSAIIKDLGTALASLWSWVSSTSKMLAFLKQLPTSSSFLLKSSCFHKIHSKEDSPKILAADNNSNTMLRIKLPNAQAWFSRTKLADMIWSRTPRVAQVVPTLELLKFTSCLLRCLS